MNVLVIDLEPREDLPDFQAPRWLPAAAPRSVVKAHREPLPGSCHGYSHVILSGSTLSILDADPVREAAAELVRDAIARGVPTLGICYGHQLVAFASLGATHVRRSTTPEMAWLPVRVRESPQGLFDGLPRAFHTFVAHYDEVCRLPEDWRVLASTERCAVQGYVCDRLRLMGFQFHPEMDLEVGNLCFARDRQKLERRGFNVDAILAGARDDGPGRLLFPRFLAYDWPSRDRPPNSSRSTA